MSAPLPPVDLRQPAADPRLWMLEPQCVFLNHGSFGSCPRAVLEHQKTLRDQMERQPIQFFVRDLEGLLDDARSVLAGFLGAAAENVVFVPNATAGVNTVLRSLTLRAGDELLVTNHEYNACRNALNVAGERMEARVVQVDIPFPIDSDEQIISLIMDRVTPRTRLALIDHVTSQTGLVLPIAPMAKALAERGVDLLVDGAHAPGMIPLNLRELGAAYYTGNCHKWICAPKGAAFLYVDEKHQSQIRPLTISHGVNSVRQDRSRFLIEFGWTGTWDPTACLTVPKALEYVGGLLPGGWPQIMERNQALAVAGRRTIAHALHGDLPCPAAMLGSIASIPLPDSTDHSPPTSPLYADPLQDWLREHFNIEVPVIPWPAPPKRVIRISSQLYNSLPQYERLAEALRKALGRGA